MYAIIFLDSALVTVVNATLAHEPAPCPRFVPCVEVPSCVCFVPPLPLWPGRASRPFVFSGQVSRISNPILKPSGMHIVDANKHIVSPDSWWQAHGSEGRKPRPGGFKPQASI